MTTQLQYGKDGDRPYALYYKHSNRTHVGSVLLAIPLSVAATLVAGAFYGYLIATLNSMMLRLVAPIGFGLAIGTTTAWIAKSGKVRSHPIALTIVSISTLASCYIACLFWVKKTFDNAFSGDPRYHLALSDLILYPSYVWSLARRIRSDGATLIIYWTIEAAVICVASLRFALSVLGQEMFCESCNRWCGKPKPFRRVEIDDSARLRRTLEAHDFSYLDALESALSDDYWEVTHDHCACCNRLHALSVTLITRNQHGGVRSTTKTKVVNRLLLDETEAKSIRQGWSVIE